MIDMTTLRTRIEGVLIQGVRIAEGWEVSIMPDVDVMDRPFDLRSTYASSHLPTVMNAAAFDVLVYLGIEEPLPITYVNL